MNKSKTLKGLSIEELQERNEFTVATAPGKCSIFTIPLC